jgi:hypothetical protein
MKHRKKKHMAKRLENRQQVFESIRDPKTKSAMKKPGSQNHRKG